jgi:hypothetical protein
MYFAIVMIATSLCTVCAAAKSEIFNPQIVATYQLAGAGPMVFDGTNLWVANGPNVTAISPSNGNVIASQNVGAQWNLVDLAYDIPGRKLWASSGHGLMKASTEQIISSNGNATILTSAAAATAISLDVSYNRQTWYVDGVTGHLIACDMGTLQVVYDIPSLDGNPFTQLNEHRSGVLAATESADGLTSNVYFLPFSTHILQVAAQYPQYNLSHGAWDSYRGTQFWGDLSSLDAYDNNGSGGFVQSVYSISDVNEADAHVVGGKFLYIAYSPQNVLAVIRQESTIPNQVYFVNGQNIFSGQVEPGVSVTGAEYVTFGAGYAFVSSPGPGIITVVSYK